MIVACRLLVLLHVGLALAQPPAPIYNFSKLNCTSLCGFRFEPPGAYTVHADVRVSNENNVTVNLGGRCVRESQLSIGNWEESARRFLELINMNDSTLDCPKWNMVYRAPNETELPRSWSGRFFEGVDNGETSMSSSSFETSVVEPAGIPGYCNITVDRGVVERNFRLYLMAAKFLYSGNPSATTGSIVSLWLKRQSKHILNMQRFPVHVQRNDSNGCQGSNCTAYETMWLPASTFGTSVLYKDGTTEHYSIFAKWKFQQIPGIENMLARLRASASHLENVVDDLSPSNIAILGLPLLIAIPPISLLEKVSSVTTAWYVFATDILAALPLLIKGIELVIAYPKTTMRMYSTLSMTGEKYGVYERWYTKCNPPVGITQALGTVLISVALWFMMASSYAEFAFWRAVQYRYGRLNTIDENSSNGIDEECEQVNEGDASDSEQMSNSCCARHRIVVLAGALLSLTVLFISSIVVQSSVVYIVNLIALFVFRVIGMNRFSQLVRWRFLIGIVAGFCGGPLYLMLHLMKKVRESKSWGDVSDGANIGIAVLGALVAEKMKALFPFHLLFAWLYGAAIIVLHAIRSAPIDRAKWGYGLNGFAAGMLFGPFGIFFKRCFPETMKDKQARTNFHGGFAFGVIFVLTVVNLITLFWVFIRY